MIFLRLNNIATLKYPLKKKKKKTPQSLQQINPRKNQSFLYSREYGSQQEISRLFSRLSALDGARTRANSARRCCVFPSMP